MSDDKLKMEEMIRMLQTGEIAPGTREGIDAIRQIASSNPTLVANSLYMLNNEFLERGMKAAGLSDEAIDDILKRDDPVDPFEAGRHQDLRLEDPKPKAREGSPFEYDPMRDLENGPRYKT